MPKIDSAAPGHIVWSEKFLDDYSLLTESTTAAWGCSSNTARAIGKGTMVLCMWLPGGTKNQLVLRDVLYMPALDINLISVPKLLAAGESYEVFYSGGAKVLRNGALVGYTPDNGGANDLYPLLCTVASESVRGGEVHPLEPMINYVKVLKSKAALMKLHCQLAHFSPERMARIGPSISPADFEYIRSCAVCKRAKLHKKPFPS